MKNITKVTTALAPLITNHAEMPMQIRVNIRRMLKAIVAFFFKLSIIKNIILYKLDMRYIIPNLQSGAIIGGIQLNEQKKVKIRINMIKCK